MLRAGDEQLDMEANPMVRWLRSHFRFTHEYHGDKFFVRKNGVLWATPLLLVLCVVEFTDVIFAVDSIPAIFAVTTDPYIVYTSNVFAILGLRALYFLLAGVMQMFHYLKVGLAFVLVFVGLKMVGMEFYKIPIAVSLGVIGGILALSILASLARQYRLERADSLPFHINPRWATAALPWVAGLVVAAIIGGVTYRTIQRGPSADEAIVALRLAETELVRTQSTGFVSAGEIGTAENSIERAWNALHHRRYSDAITAAHRAREVLNVGK
jgi:hypothetical protein